MRYRIIKEVQKNGKELFYVQKRGLFYFWRYVRQVQDITMYSYRVTFTSLNDAENFVKEDVRYRHQKNQERVVRSEVVKEWA